MRTALIIIGCIIITIFYLTPILLLCWGLTKLDEDDKDGS